MPSIKRSIRVDRTLMTDVKAIAEELHQSENQVIETSLKFYRDYHFMQNKACFINEQIINILQAMSKMSENNINQKSNRLIKSSKKQKALSIFVDLSKYFL